MQQCWCVVITGGGSEAKFLRLDVLSDAKQQIPLAGLILSSSSVNSERERASLPFMLALQLQCPSCLNLRKMPIESKHYTMMKVDGTRQRGRPRKTRWECIEETAKSLGPSGVDPWCKNKSLSPF